MFVEPRTLDQLVHRATRYEVLVSVDGDVVGRIAFSGRKSRANLMENIGDNANFIRSFTTEDDLDAPCQKTAARIKLGVKGRIQVYYGTTERDVRSAMERAAV